MNLIGRARSSRLDRITIALLLMALVLAPIHHADHVLRVDHSGWPFRPQVTPFTFSLLACPMILFALFGSRRLLGARLLLLALGTAFTLDAHTTLETPAMQLAMWAQNHSLDPHATGLHNVLGVQSLVMSVAAVIVGMALNVTAAAATGSMLWRYGHRRHDQAR